MEAVVNPLRRPNTGPPQPVDPSNPVWMAMFYQWLIDKVMHLDDCMDATQEAHRETQAELAAWMGVSRDSHDDLSTQIENHLKMHNLIDQTKQAKRSVWIFQWETIKEVGKIASSGTVIAIVFYVLNQLM